MKRIPQLDGVRGVAILLVLIWHYFPCELAVKPDSPVFTVSRLFSLTWSGVDLFFVLSGFLIAGILLDHRETANYFRVFYVRRICRIFPLYFLMLALFIVLCATPLASSPSFKWLFHDPMPTWSYATFTQNVFMGVRGDFGPHWLGVTWSLAVEEQFYLFVPLLIYALPRRPLLGVLCAAIVAAPVMRYLSPGFHAFVNTPWRSDSLLSGAALAVLVRSNSFVIAARARRKILAWAFVIFLAGAAVITTNPLPLGSAFVHFWLAGLYSTFVLIAYLDTEPRLVGILRSRPLLWLGQLSYGIYMFHQAASGLLFGWLRQGPPQIRTVSDAGITLAALGFTFLVAVISFRYFENPILRYGHRFQYSGKQSSASPSSVLS